jgi:membrane-associated phospholipid phosphatase
MLSHRRPEGRLSEGIAGPSAMIPAMRARWRGVCLIATGAVVALSIGAATLGVPPLELAVRDSILAWGYSEVTEFLALVNAAGTWRVLAPGALLWFLLLPASRPRWWLWLAILVAGPLVGELCQPLVARPRPDGRALGFPSGHATSIATFATATLYLAMQARPVSFARTALVALVVLVALLVGLARILLGAHWPLDVLGGFAAGTGSAAAAAWWDAGHPPAGDAPL